MYRAFFAGEVSLPAAKGGAKVVFFSINQALCAIFSGQIVDRFLKEPEFVLPLGVI
jgi:hypothetical protein